MSNDVDFTERLSMRVAEAAHNDGAPTAEERALRDAVYLWFLDRFHALGQGATLPKCSLEDALRALRVVFEYKPPGSRSQPMTIDEGAFALAWIGARNADPEASHRIDAFEDGAHGEALSLEVGYAVGRADDDEPVPLVCILGTRPRDKTIVCMGTDEVGDLVDALLGARMVAIDQARPRDPVPS